MLLLFGLCEGSACAPERLRFCLAEPGPLAERGQFAVCMRFPLGRAKPPLPPREVAQSASPVASAPARLDGPASAPPRQVGPQHQVRPADRLSSTPVTALPPPQRLAAPTSAELPTTATVLPPRQRRLSISPTESPPLPTMSSPKSGRVQIRIVAPGTTFIPHFVSSPQNVRVGSKPYWSSPFLGALEYVPEGTWCWSGWVRFGLERLLNRSGTGRFSVVWESTRGAFVY